MCTTPRLRAASGLSELQRAMQLMQRDVLELSQRSVRDELGDALPALSIGTDVPLEMTRFGWRNPLGQRRSELQRIAYVVRDDVLYRYYWNVLDRAEDTQPVTQVLLHGVSNIEFSAVDAGGNAHAFWPIAAGDSSAIDPTTKLAAIQVQVTVAPFGEITRLWDVPVPFTVASSGPVSP